MTIRSVCEKLPLYYPGLQLDQWNKPVAWIFSCCDFILLNGLVSSSRLQKNHEMHVIKIYVYVSVGTSCTWIMLLHASSFLVN